MDMTELAARIMAQDRRALEARRAELRAQLYTALCNVTGDDRWCDEAAAGTEGPSPPPLPRRSAA
mgnify:CR=1 FL=1